MKKVALLISSCLLSIFASAQIERYELTYDQETFTPFSGGEELFVGEMWEQYDSTAINLPFDFPVWDTTVSQIYFETTGRLILNNNHLWFIDIFTQDGLIDAESFAMGDVSPIHYRSITQNGLEGLEIQVLEALYSNFQDSVSFQLRLFENGSIQYVMGPHTNPKVGPGQAMWQEIYCGVYHAEQMNPMSFFQGQSFYGDFDNLQDTVYQGAEDPFQTWSWDSIPPSNSRFTIAPKTSPSTGTGEVNQSDNLIHFYANRIWTDEPVTIQVHTINGQLIYKGKSDQTGVTLNHRGMVIVSSTNNQRRLCLLH